MGKTRSRHYRKKRHIRHTKRRVGRKRHKSRRRHRMRSRHNKRGGSSHIENIINMPMVKHTLVNGLYVVELGPGEHKASDIPYWDEDKETGVGFICIEDGNKIQFKGAGKDKTKVTGGGFYIGKGSTGELHNMTIEGASPNGVSIGEKNAVGIIKQCKIQESDASGVSVMRGGKAVLDDCDIWNNKKIGVHTDKTSYLEMRNCRLWDNGKKDLEARGRYQMENNDVKEQRHILDTKAYAT